jgi:hypothetical protein
MEQNKCWKTLISLCAVLSNELEKGTKPRLVPLGENDFGD